MPKKKKKKTAGEGDRLNQGKLRITSCWFFYFGVKRSHALETSVAAAVIRLPSHVRLFETPMGCSMPGFPGPHHLPEVARVHVHWISEAIQLAHPLLSSSPPAFSLTQHQGLFQWVSSLHQVAKVLKFQLSSSSSDDYSGLISFRKDWFDLLELQSTLKSLHQPHSSKASILRIQLSLWSTLMASLDAMILVFWMLSFKPTFSLSSFTFNRRLFSSLLSAIKVVLSAYLTLLIILPAILIPACASSSLAFHMM